MDKYKVLGRVYRDATPNVVIYKVPLPTNFEVADAGPRTDATVLYTIISSIVVCNHSATESDFSIAVREDDSLAPTSATTEDYIFKTTPIAANNTIIINPGITLPAIPTGTDGENGADIIVAATDGEISFHVYGVEVTQ